MKRFLFILLAVVMVMGTTVTAFAMDYPTSLPELPYNHDSNIVVFKDKNNNHTLFIAELDNAESLNECKFLINQHVADEQGVKTEFIIVSNLPYKLYTYTLTDGVWRHNGTVNNTEGQQVPYTKYDTSIVYANVDLYDYQNPDRVVFPLPPVPLAEEIRNLTEETLTVETMPELNKTVLVVVLCGVGCLALVTSLVLLRKVLPRFLN